MQKKPYNFALRTFSDDIAKFCIDYENWKARKSEDVTKENLKISIADRIKMIHDKFDESIGSNKEEKGYFVNNKLKSVFLKDMLSGGQELLGFNKEKDKFIQKLCDNGFSQNDPKLRTEFFNYFDSFYSFFSRTVREFEDLDEFEKELDKIV